MKPKKFLKEVSMTDNPNSIFDRLYDAGTDRFMMGDQVDYPVYDRVKSEFEQDPILDLFRSIVRRVIREA